MQPNLCFLKDSIIITSVLSNFKKLTTTRPSDPMESILAEAYSLLSRGAVTTSPTLNLVKSSNGTTRSCASSIILYRSNFVFCSSVGLDRVLSKTFNSIYKKEEKTINHLKLVEKKNSENCKIRYVFQVVVTKFRDVRIGVCFHVGKILDYPRLRHYTIF